MRRLQVAVFNTQPPHLYFGGVERRIIEVAKRLQDEADISVYCGTKKGFKKTYKADGITFVPCFSTDTLFPIDNWFFNRAIARKANTINADVYEAHTASGLGFLKAIRKRYIRKPFVQTIHGVLADEYTRVSKDEYATLRMRLSQFPMRYLSQVEKEAAKHATLVVTVSRYSSEKIVEFYNVDSAKIRVVPNGVDLEKFQPRKSSETVKQKIGVKGKQCALFVGRLVPRKGLHFLIEAATRVVEENKEIRFVVVGDGPLRNRLISYAKELGIQDYFAFLGEVPDEMLAAFYNCADLFVLPSTQEGQGLALLEAQASGKPVIAFNAGAISETMVQGKTGLLTQPNKDELAQAILKLLSDSSLRENMGDSGRKFVSENFSWNSCAERMFNVYNEAIERSKD
jgi:glycosyltransferase involved in cell wall biosynthesis